MRNRTAGSALALIALLAVGAGRAQEVPGGSPPVGLDALLKLPSEATRPLAPGERAGGDRERWEKRFGDLRTELADAKADLAEAQAELEDLARGSDAWQMAAPGAQHDPETSPISHKLRSEIRGHREDIARIERRLRDLDVEASLAGVPPEWRRPPHEDAVPGS